MRRSVRKVINRKRPSHPDEAHTKAKSWFKRKSRKSVRKFEKQQIKDPQDQVTG